MKISSNYCFVSLIALLLLLAYAHTFNFPFQFDDYNVIVDEPKVHSLSAWWQSMPGMRPLLKFSYALNWQFDNSARYFRAFNLFCHFVTSILVWKLCVKLLPILRKDNLHTNRIALLAACLFALHPAHTEVVSYISSRSTGLMTLLCMVSLLFFLAYIQPIKNHKIAYLVASILCWLLAILVKEPAIALPLLAWLLFKLTHPSASIYAGFKQLTSCKKLLLILLFSVPIVYVWFVPQYANLVSQVFSPASLYSQLLSQPSAHLHYLTQTLLGLNLNVDYQLDLPKILDLQASLQAAWILATGGMALFYFMRFPLICFCVLWWFICLIPSNSFVPRLDIVNDRQIYMASIAPILFVSVHVIYLSDKLKKLKLVPPAALILLALGAAWMRNWDYESEVTLWQSSLRQQANNARAWNNLGYAYLQANKKQEAKNAFEYALKLDDTNYKAYYNLEELKKK